MIIRGTIISPHDPIMKDGAIVVAGNQIIAKGLYSEIINDFDTRQIIGDKNSIVIPGFVNTHSHAVQTLFRGLGDNYSLLDWLNQVILPGEAQMTENEVYSSCKIGYAEMLLSGITTTNDMLTGNHSFKGLEAAVDSGIRGKVGKMLMDRNVPEEMLASTEEVMDEAMELADIYTQGRIEYAFSPRFIKSCTDDLMRAASAAARERGQLFHTHASENRNEISEVVRITGKSNIKALNELGCLGKHSILAHCVWTEAEERDLIQTTGTAISHNPTSNAKLASGIAPVPEYLNRGIPTGLATDGSPASGGHDFFLEMRLASFLQSLQTGNAQILSAKDIFETATLGGAKALGYDDIGRLQTGYKADITVLEPKYPSAFPIHNPYSFLVYTANVRDVSTVMVDGITRVSNGKIVEDLETYFSLAQKYSQSRS